MEARGELGDGQLLYFTFNLLWNQHVLQLSFQDVAKAIESSCRYFS